MSEPAAPRDLLYGGRDEASARPAPPNATPTALERAFAFVDGLNTERRANPVDYGDEDDWPELYELADEHGLIVKPEQFRRLLLLDRARGLEIGTALWKNSSRAVGHWTLYVDALAWGDRALSHAMPATNPTHDPARHQT